MVKKNEYKTQRLKSLLIELEKCQEEKKDILDRIEQFKKKNELHFHESELDARMEANLAHFTRVVAEIKKLKEEN